MSDTTTLLTYITKLEATYQKLKQKMVREKNMFKTILTNLSQNLGVKCNEYYFENLTIQDEDPTTSWNVLLNKTDNIIRIRKDLTKKEITQVKQKRKRRTRLEILQQQQIQ